MRLSKQAATLISINTAFALAVIKLIGGVATGSVSVLSSAVDSILDIGSSTVNFFAIKASEQPPDAAHRYGHGKFESLASFLQSIVITLSGFYILYEAYKKFTAKEGVKDIEGGLWVMLFSIAVTFALVFMLKRVAKRENSAILKTEALHYEIDLLTGAGVLLGLILVKYTGISAIDPAISVLIALKTVYSAALLGRDVSEDLLDKSLCPDDMAKIRDILDGYSYIIVDYHRVRTRKAGTKKFADMHILVSKYLSIDDAHFIADVIEKEISDALGGADVQIHIEPCEPELTHGCSQECCEKMMKDIEDFKKEKGGSSARI
jgi:cation diffusion facilitator family transporter